MAIDRIALSDVRHLVEAQKGNPVAFAALLEPYLVPVWSVCRAFFAEERDAVRATAAFRDRVRAALPSLAADHPFGLQLFALLWTHLTEDLEPRAQQGLQEVVPRVDLGLRPEAPDDAARIRQALLSLPPVPRLVYLFWLVTDLPAATLASVVGLDEAQVRLARRQATAQLQEALAP